MKNIYVNEYFNSVVQERARASRDSGRSSGGNQASSLASRLVKRLAQLARNKWTRGPNFDSVHQILSSSVAVFNLVLPRVQLAFNSHVHFSIFPKHCHNFCSFDVHTEAAREEKEMMDKAAKFLWAQCHK